MRIDAPFTWSLQPTACDPPAGGSSNGRIVPGGGQGLSDFGDTALTPARCLGAIHDKNLPAWTMWL